MQPNQNAAGTPNRNTLGAAGGIGASPARAGAGVSPVRTGVGVSQAGADVAGAARVNPARVNPTGATARVAGAGVGTAGAAGARAAGAAGAFGAAGAPATANPIKPTPRTKEPEQNIMAQGVNKKKSGKGMLYGLILCLILAVGGIGFGVWAMMDGNSQIAKKDESIKDLKQQNSKLLEQLSDAEAIDDQNTYKNPVIKSDGEVVPYSIGFQSSYILGQSGTRRVGISIKDGKIEKCSLMEQVDASAWNEIGECAIDGIEGNIFKVAEFGQGQDNSGNMIGFIMEDGKVAYLKLYDFEANSSVNIAGYLNIDGYITDVLEISVSNGAAGGYGSSVFVKNDGSYVVYNESMLKQ